MSQQPTSLQDVISRLPNIVDHLYNNPRGAKVYPGMPPEFTNWRDEQRAWRESVALFEQSYNDTNLLLRGPGALQLLENLAVNSFAGFEPGRAKQFVCCNPDGYVIGDVILFHPEPHTFLLTGRPSAVNWVQYHGETAGSGVELEREDWSPANPHARKVFRFQLQGPLAPALIKKLTGLSISDVKFFHLARASIAGYPIGLLHHGMAGVEGAELFGPYRDREAVREAIVEAGREFGLRQVGSRAYSTNALESGWIPCPLPAIYTGDAVRAYRQWLPADCYEATGSLGGSFYSRNVEDYYLTPWDLGYGHIVKFDHDFVGRDALERRAAGPHRKKVTFVWEPEEAARVTGSLFTRPEGKPYKYLDLPGAQYATWMYDRVENDRGDLIGFSMWTGFSANEGYLLSLGMVDEAYSKPGTQVTIVWGEGGGGSRKPSVEPHAQTRVRVTVAQVPFSEAARAYRAKLRGR